jgi:DNA-binding transcriptional MerR regulator
MKKSNERKAEAVSQEQRKSMLKIGDVSRLSGLGVEALRFYEKSALLDRPARTDSGYRMYRPEVLQRLKFIKQAQTLGFTLDEIRHIIEQAKEKSPCDEVREILRQRLSEVDRRIREMKRYRKAIAETLDRWEENGQAPGHICGLIESSHLEGGVKPEKGIGRGKTTSTIRL